MTEKPLPNENGTSMEARDPAEIITITRKTELNISIPLFAMYHPMNKLGSVKARKELNWLCCKAIAVLFAILPKTKKMNTIKGNPSNRNKSLFLMV
jgi:hypothetical protein